MIKDIFKRKTRLEKLTAQYTALMKRSYEKALNNNEESKKLKQKAMKIREEIKELNFSFADA